MAGQSTARGPSPKGKGNSSRRALGGVSPPTGGVFRPKAWGLGLTWAGQAGLDLIRYRLGLDAGSLGMKLGPDALLETVNRQLVALEDAVADGEA